MILDSGPLISLALNEPTAGEIARILSTTDRLLLCAPNLTEVAIVRYRRAGTPPERTREEIREMGIRIVDLDESLAIEAASARVRYSIRFGDGFVYALAKREGEPILTLDAEFAKTDAALVPLP